MQDYIFSNTSIGASVSSSLGIVEPCICIDKTKLVKIYDALSDPDLRIELMTQHIFLAKQSNSNPLSEFESKVKNYLLHYKEDFTIEEIEKILNYNPQILIYDCLITKHSLQDFKPVFNKLSSEFIDDLINDKIDEVLADADFVKENLFNKIDIKAFRGLDLPPDIQDAIIEKCIPIYTKPPAHGIKLDHEHQFKLIEKFKESGRNPLAASVWCQGLADPHPFIKSIQVHEVKDIDAFERYALRWYKRGDLTKEQYSALTRETESNILLEAI